MVRVRTENRKRTKTGTKTEDLEGMIKQLNAMSIDDPAYGSTYFKVLALDDTGVAQKCITRPPKVLTVEPRNYVSRASLALAPTPYASLQRSPATTQMPFP